ncbi:MAG TPA: sialate O-acetylesterase [Opitutaceae bacterium]|nr:sialate O-acetylesterase [Opitutaceae bacterium]
MNPVRVVLVSLVLVAAARAEVALPKIFGDHVVLQRELAVPIWGTAAPGEAVIVRFSGQEKRATADAAGRWRVQLAPLAASAEPRDLVVAGANTLTLHDILVGEVWLCSGQSNMEMAVGVTSAGAAPESAHEPGLAEEIKTATFPALRLFRVEKKLQPADVVSAGWTACQGDALAHFSAAGFFFGRALQEKFGVPVGLIESAWGGSRIEEWTPDDAYARLEKILGADADRCFERDARMVSRNYDAMIAPLAPFALRGVLWYQGESNIIPYNDGLHYADKFAVLLASWRAAWQRPDLPIYSVQLAPYLYTQRKDKLAHADDELPKLWEAQLAATALPHSGLVPIADTVDDVKNIHPGKKNVVGQRLAALALADTYGRKDTISSGPIFERAEFANGKAFVHFAHVTDGLATSDGKSPTDFELAGADGHFVAANAVLRGDTVELTSPEVAAPTLVRFAWHETAHVTLTNRAGWPAYPFRSDAPKWSPPN